MLYSMTKLLDPCGKLLPVGELDAANNRLTEFIVGVDDDAVTHVNTV